MFNGPAEHQGHRSVEKLMGMTDNRVPPDQVDRGASVQLLGMSDQLSGENQGEGTSVCKVMVLIWV